MCVFGCCFVSCFSSSFVFLREKSVLFKMCKRGFYLKNIRENNYKKSGNFPNLLLSLPFLIFLKYNDESGGLKKGSQFSMV